MKRCGLPGKKAQSRICSRRLSSHGVTFVELLFVIFVFVAAGAGILGSYLSTHYLAHYARETMIATEDLKDMMERINSTPYTTLFDCSAGTQLEQFPDGAVNGPAQNQYVNIVSSNGQFPLVNEQVTVTYPNLPACVGGTIPNRAEVLVTVAWTGAGGRQRTMSLSTVRTGN